MMKIQEIKSQAPARICLFGDQQGYLNLQLSQKLINTLKLKVLKIMV